MLKPGLYEKVISKKLREELNASKDDQIADIQKIDKAEASKILTNYISSIIESGLKEAGEEHGIENQIYLTNSIVETVRKALHRDDIVNLSVDDQAEQLLSVFNIKNSTYVIDKNNKMIRPETSISQSSLFTGAVHEPQMITELKKEIVSCSRIDFLVSFIKWSGLRQLINELRDFTNRGGHFRVITTSYLGATDIKAIEELSSLENTEIRISYDTKRTRLHAKSYVFYRDTDYSTAYVGSSNISDPALSSGLEWNVKVTKQDQPDVMNKIDATFETYWNSKDFEIYTADQKDRLTYALEAERNYKKSGGSEGSAGLGMKDFNFNFDIHPYPYQQEILDRLRAEREVRKKYKNLVVAATGTGKTVISALDYRNYCRATNHKKYARLLFVAHREEILKQSLQCFQGVLRDQNFGSLFVGNERPDQIEYLFISIQTFNSRSFTDFTEPDFYDFIIVDEFHHAAANSYQKLLGYYKPKILLGLTATPERMDQKDILKYFDHRIAAEIRLPEAIDRKMLCPFQYFGVSDSVDLSKLKWSRGGYDQKELSNIYTLSGRVASQRAKLIIESISKYVTDIQEVIGLGFCVSKEHSAFMAKVFNENNIPAISLTSDSSNEERKNAKNNLVKGVYKFIFCVDIYNEGVDIPEVNTVLFLRPTESLTIFLQQLGRGLRLSNGKECLTVLDFIGQSNIKYNFEEKFKSLLSYNNHSIDYELKHGFTSVPKGCYIQLEKKASEYILENIKSSYTGKRGLISRIRTFTEDTGKELTLANFVNHYHLDIREIYAKFSFSRLCVWAGVKLDFQEELEDDLTKSFSRFSAIDSRRWIEFLLYLLSNLNDIDFNSLSAVELRMLRMFYITIWQKYIPDFGEDEALEHLYMLVDSPIMLAELIELLQLRYDQIDFIDEPLPVDFECPLDLHCSYTARQILAAFDDEKVMAFREGVKWLPNKKTDIFFITLNKSDKDYSPTTMYNDYSINDVLFHWQSQSTTSDTSKTGQRYIHHKEQGSNIIVCVREFKNDMAGAAPYTVLGLCDFVKYEGSRPMNITWKLEKPIPAKYLKKTNKLVV